MREETTRKTGNQTVERVAVHGPCGGSMALVPGRRGRGRGEGARAWRLQKALAFTPGGAEPLEVEQRRGMVPPSGCRVE